MACIIIDGYNLIRQSRTLSQIEAKNFEMGRVSLVRKLSEYRKLKGHQITVVFDAADTDNISLEEYRTAGVRVFFSEMMQKADAVIIRMAREIGRGGIVVSSDREILSAARKAGCGVLQSNEFEKKLNEAVMYADAPSPRLTANKSATNKRWITQKKGPSHRLPKAKRRALAKLRGL